METSSKQWDPFADVGDSIGATQTAIREALTPETLLAYMQRKGKVPSEFSLSMEYPDATATEIHHAVTYLANRGYIGNDPGESYAVSTRLEKCRFNGAPTSPVTKPESTPTAPKPKPPAPTALEGRTPVVSTSSAQPKPAAKSTGSAKPQSAKPATLYRDPHKQNEHQWCLIGLQGLTPTERWVGQVMHSLIYVDGKRGDVSPSRKLTAGFIADKAGVSRSKAQDAAAKLVAKGLFVRLDNGKGGRKRRDKTGTGYGAVYRPTVPSWWE